MSRRRWTWTRSRYERARRLSRMLGRFGDLPDCPPIVARYHDLLSRISNHDDPLLTPVKVRLGWRQGIPF